MQNVIMENYYKYLTPASTLASGISPFASLTACYPDTPLECLENKKWFLMVFY